MDASNPSASNAAVGEPAATRRAWLPDLSVIAVIVVLWWCWLCPEVTRRHPVAYDTYRDAAGAENVLAGRWFCDPMIAGETYWYAPLGPMVFAGISALAGQPPLSIYSASVLWLNVLLPIGWYALARTCWGWRAGLAAVPLIWLGSRWWSSHIAMPMTSIQGVILLTGVLLAWLASLGRRRRWTVAVGVLLAVCTWHHTLSGIIAAAAIAFHAVAGASAPFADAPGRSTGRRRDATARALIVAAGCAPLVAPLAWHLLSIPIVNPAPIEYASSLLHDPEFALQTRAWLVYPLAVVGLVSVCKKLHQPAGVIVGYGLASLVGQAWGYLRVAADVSVPVLIPHEFQWNFQIALGLLAANGAARTAAWVAGRFERRGARREVPHTLAMLLLVVLALGREAKPGLEWKSRFWRPSTISASRAAAVDWIKRNTSIDDVFFASQPQDYLLVAGWTGRKLVSSPEGHTSMAVSAERRARDRRRMLETTDQTELRELLSGYRVRYVLLTGDDVVWRDRWGMSALFDPVFGAHSRSLTILRLRRDLFDRP